MLDPTVWGTVAAWVGALVTGLSVLFGVIYYVFDRRRDRRAQAGAVVIWLHPHEHGPPLIKMLNLSGKPVFDHGCLIESKPRRELQKLQQKGWDQSGPFEWPPDCTFKWRHRHTFLNFHGGGELFLADSKSAEYLPPLKFAPAAYNYYAYFRDASGRYWVVNARTGQLVHFWTRRRSGIGPGGLDTT